MKLHPRLTAEGVLLARRAERFRPVAERDGRGWVVGYGHRASAREGARVGEAEATALLAYDLAQSAGRLEPLLRAPVSPALFDALNAYAFRAGLEAFGRSETLRRVNAGDIVAPAQVLEARDRPVESAPSAVLAAAQAVRDRLSQVLDASEPPPRARRSPRPEQPADPAPPAVATEPPGVSYDPEVRDAFSSAPPGDAQDPGRHAPELDGEDDRAFPPASDPVEPDLSGDGPGVADAEAEREEPAPPPLIAAEEHDAAWPPEPASAPPTPPPAPPSPSTSPPTPTPTPAAPWRPSGNVPLVSFARGGRPRLWDRMRANPYVYMAVGACGLALFGCALLGFLLGRPTAVGLALGVVGVICLAPALAFFLHRRGGGRAGGPTG